MIVSYVNEIREELPLDRIDQKADVIFDIFAAHQRDFFDFEIEMPQNPAPFFSAAFINKLQTWTWT